MNVIFLGPPGSGKGTQAQRLAPELNAIHLSTGDVFREAIKNQTPLGQKIKSYVDSGNLVPDSLVSEVVFEKLKQLKGKSGVMLDGYPRTLEQSVDFDKFSEREKFSIDAVLFFDVSSDALVKRLSSRRQCGKCKEVFNLMTRKPKVEGKCDLCSNDLIQRPDDKAEVVEERLKVYDRLTAPMLNHYKNFKGYKRIDAAQDIEKVHADVLSFLKSQETAGRK